MTYLYKPEEPYIPEVIFSDGLLKLKGESYMEDPYGFYLPLLNVLKKYLDEHSSLEIEIELYYLNTSSSKCIHQILDTMKQYQNKGKKIDISWFYDEEDDQMINDIEDFEHELNIEFNKYKC